MPSAGPRIPMMHLIKDYSSIPVSFGTMPLSNTYSGHHIGMQKPASHVAAFINAENIIIADDDKFFLFTPKKKDLQNDFHKLVLPSHDSHFIHMGKRGNAYKIQQGSSMIITDENAYIHYVVIFPGSMEFFAKVRQNMLFIFQHYQNVWATILSKRDGRHFINIDLFKKVMIHSPPSSQPPPPLHKEVEQTNKHKHDHDNADEDKDKEDKEDKEDKKEDNNISLKKKQKVLE